ncbi:phosphoglycerate kinase [Patescibacteria group bacterium]|nr:phosphoglycerate kinase [Patescibacteria group bacterium]MBU1727735.1 phosphoglycerate kinase [Patescibacteria group bacterium]
MKSIKNLKNIKGKTALVRVDFNVPIKNGKIEDDFRIKKALPTIKFLQKKGVKVILISHIGKDGKQSLKPVVNYLKKFIKKDIVLFENIRRQEGETKNSSEFAKKLSKLGEIYVNDAFSVSHRNHASIVGLPKYLPSYAGFQLEEEVKNLSKITKNKKHPFLFILGGAKFSTKMPLIKKYLKLADHIFIGGALLNDFLKAKGYEVGKSLVSDTKGIKEILGNRKLILPEDVIVSLPAGRHGSGNKLMNKKISEIKKSEIILDVGSSTEKILAPIIKKSKLIVWNGPLGKYEEGGDKATKAILKLVLESKNQVVIGGGDIVNVLSKLKAKNYKLKANLFVSTGGGATLDFLSNGTLPGIKALG